MSALRNPLFVAIAMLPVALLGVAACGGKSFSAADGYGGQAGSAGAGVGGDGRAGAGLAGSSVGGSANAGAPTGGSTTGGSSTGGSATGGSANGGTSTGGSANGGAAGGGNIRTCVENTDCVIEPTSCCSCGTGPVTAYTAINAKYVSTFNPQCQTLDCGACPPTSLNLNDPRLYYVPTCKIRNVGENEVVSECEVVDIRTKSDITSCKSDADCALRAGTACCQGCGGTGTGTVAINPFNESELEALVCPRQALACAACAPNTNALAASCLAGQCNVAFGNCPADAPCTPFPSGG